jgi:S1-C subfamily serine protease
MRRIIAFGPAFVVLLSAGVLTLAIPGVVRRVHVERTRATVTAAQELADAGTLLEQVNQAIRAVAEAAEPSVVHIETVQADPAAGRFSSGSGWVYDESGHIITNAHVVAAARDVSVQFSDAFAQQATVVGMDMAADIAVLRVEPGAHLIPMRRATGERVRKGDRVFAFGSPFNFRFSMSEGIVSGLGRTARTATGFSSPANYIQTDAAVNPGNSGGPLVDIRGRLVGMNVAIATAQDTQGATEGQSAGISFAIPLALIEARAEQIISGAPPVGGFIGILFGSNEEGRVRIGRVVQGSPAAAAGLLEGDVILSAQGQTLREPDELRGITTALRPGDNLALVVRRGEQNLDLTVTLGAMTPERAANQYFDAVRRELGIVLRGDERETVAWFVAPGSPADNAGIEAGQHIRSVAGEPVKDPVHAVERLVTSGAILGRPVEVGVSDDAGDAAQVRTVTIRASRR